MKPLKLLSASILIASALLLSRAKNASEQSQSHRSDQHNGKATPHAEPVKQQEPQVPFSVWQATVSALQESLAANKQQAITSQKQTEANQQSFCSPAVVVNEVLAAIGAGYLFLMYLQWGAIEKQAKFIKLAYTAARPYSIPDNFTMLNFTTHERRTDQSGLVFMTVDFVLKNVGKGPAIIQTAQAKLKILPDDPSKQRLLPNPSDDWGDLSDCVALALDSQVVAAESTLRAQVGLNNLPTEDDYKAIKMAYTKHIIVYGSLDYLDAAGEPYSATFGRVYRPKGMLNDEHFTVGPGRYNRT
jgi:hypothetical protein